MIPISQHLLDPYQILKVLLKNYKLFPVEVFAGNVNGWRQKVTIQEKSGSSYVVNDDTTPGMTLSLDEVMELVKSKNHGIIVNISFTFNGNQETAYHCYGPDCFTEREYTKSKKADIIKRKWKLRNSKEKVTAGLKKLRMLGEIDYAPPDQFYKGFPGGKEYHRFMDTQLNETFSFGKNKKKTTTLKDDIFYLKTFSVKS